MCPLEVYTLKQIRVSTGKYTIQRKERKETRHASVHVEVYIYLYNKERESRK